MNKRQISKKEKIDSGFIEIPGSKSYTNRALVIASLAEGISKLKNPLKSDDTAYMIESLKSLGIDITEGEDFLEVNGKGGRFNYNGEELFAGIAGTTSRFLSAIGALVGNKVVINGEGELLERPIHELVNGLKQLGAEVRYLGVEGSIPIEVNGKFISESFIQMKGDTSSQFFTALLMIAPILKKGIEVNIIGDLVSKSYIDITIDIMKTFGVDVINENYKKLIVERGQKYTAQTYTIEGDWSSASYFLGIGTLMPGSITLDNLNPHSVQGDREFLAIIDMFGANVKVENSRIFVSAPDDRLSSIDVNMEQMPDTAMTAMAIAAFAEGRTKLTGLSTLRVKETDRIKAMKIELTKCGINVETGSDWMIIEGNPDLKLDEEIIVDTYHDHRIAMSMSLIGARCGNMIINNPLVVKKSFPQFWKFLDGL